MKNVTKTNTVSAFMLFFILGASTAAIGASLPIFAVHFDLAQTNGNVIVAYNFGAFISVTAIAILGSKLRPVPTIVGLLASFCVGMALMFISPSWNVFLISSWFAGIGYGGLTLLLNTACAQGYGNKSMIMVNWLNATFGLGAICGPAIVGYVGLQNMMTLPLGACILALLGIPAYKLGYLLKTNQENDHTANLRVFQPIILLFLALGFLYAGMETSIGTWFSASLVSTGWELGAASTTVAYFWFGIAMGRFVLPYIAIKLEPPTALICYLGSGTILLTLANLTGELVLFYPLVGFAISPILPSMFAWASKLSAVPQRLTALLSIFAMFGNATVPSLIERTSTTDDAGSITLSILSVCIIATVVALACFHFARGSKTFATD